MAVAWPSCSAAARTRGAMLPAPLPNCSNAAAIAATASRMVMTSATSASVISLTLSLSRRCRDRRRAFHPQALDEPDEADHEERREVEPVRRGPAARHQHRNDLEALFEARTACRAAET